MRKIPTDLREEMADTLHCKKCSKCKELKLWKDFNLRENNRPVSWCKKCISLYTKRTTNKYQHERKFKERQLVLDHYGRKCVCCGETIYEFLAIDHIMGKGGKHRKEIGGHLTRWIIKK